VASARGSNRINLDRGHDHLDPTPFRFGSGTNSCDCLVGWIFDMGANVLFVYANRQGMLSLVSVITALYPVSTIVLALRLDREKANRSQYVGMACAGLALVFVSLGR